MLSRALPMDVVRVIGGHVREHAAVMLQKWVRGAAVRFAWGVPGHGPCLCDMAHAREPGVHVEVGPVCDLSKCFTNPLG